MLISLFFLCSVVTYFDIYISLRMHDVVNYRPINNISKVGWLRSRWMIT